MAARLAEAGVAAGDRVAIMCGNGPAILQAYLGCAWLGAIATPINVASRGAQLEHIFNNCGAKLAVVEADLRPRSDRRRRMRAPLTQSFGSSATQRPEVAGLRRSRRCPRPATPMTPRPSRPATRSRSSTPRARRGRRKASAARRRNISGGRRIPRRCSAWARASGLLTTLPLFHTNALNTFYQALLTGSTLIVEKRFSVSDFLPSLQTRRRDRDLSARRHGPDAAVAPGKRRRARAWRARRAGAGRSGRTPRGFHAPVRHCLGRRLRLDGDQFRHRRSRPRPAARHDGAAAPGFPRARRRRRGQ